MCGVNMVVNDQAHGQEIINSLMNANRHRGPDHSDWVKINDGTFLAGNRLKTLDLKDGANLPLVDQKNGFYLVWNGFLYNYPELKNRLLDLGEEFLTHSDGEVLFKWLKRFGMDGMKSLNGMYALTFVDAMKGFVMIARDPTGMKPLYYLSRNDQLYCASEAKSIQKSIPSPFNLDQSQIAPYLFLRHAMPQSTFLKEIKELSPGSVKIFNLNGDYISEHHVNIDPDSTGIKNSDKFEILLKDAILKHLHADVPIGMLLSGGADSALLYHMWYKETGQPLPTYTTAFGDRNGGDAPFARSLAKKYHGAHHEILVTPDLFLKVWPDYIRTLDQPIGDSAGFLTWLMAEKAKEKVKILISGAGADELWGGYNRHSAFKVYLRYHRWVDFLVRLKKFSPLMGRRGKKMLNAMHPLPERTFMNFAALMPLPEKLANSLLEQYPSDLPAYKSALEWDRSIYLVNDILKIHDNACMVHGIEGRAPYLDGPLISFSQGLEEKTHLEMPSKFWIKEILKRDGLEGFANRKKSGFGLPIREWLLTHQGFRATVFSGLNDLEKNYPSWIPVECLNLIKNPEKHAKENFLLFYNVFVLSEWIKENRL
ncbi:MAG: asparagine synthase (glutamine-hydrolyzing) [Cyclobacteriaceae bacterium]